MGGPSDLPVQAVRPEEARSSAFKPLPLPLAETSASGPISLVLFYQYVEPQWTSKEHRVALKTVIALGERCGVNGRGRCAAEGLNCTLTGSAASVRAFCMGLREWRPQLFNQTDFKITDGLAAEHGFKALTIQKKADLVAYGLPSEVAPSLQTSRARHVEADEYHELMAKPNTVIIDVRNAYESAIGHFAPPPGGAELIDPKLRNSIEFPKWINAPETQEKLHGKQVLMYCTGGIRCERASALVDALARTSGGAFAPADTVMVRGGIERYMKTFPEGGYWKGKNYLFDRRLEQAPDAKSEAALAADVESRCCVCKGLCASYRGQFVCAGWLAPTNAPCGVPVIVCSRCARDPPDAGSLRCPLCEDGYLPPAAKPDLLPLKRALEEEAARGEGQQAGGGGGSDGCAARMSSKRARQEARAAKCAPSTRLFVGNLPFVVTASELRATLLASLRGESPTPPEGTREAKRLRRALRKCARDAADRNGATDAAAFAGACTASGAARSGEGWRDEEFLAIRWLADRVSGLFYGSAFVEVASVLAASSLVKAAAHRDLKEGGGVTVLKGGITLRGRRLRVHYAPPPRDSCSAGSTWSPSLGCARVDGERPPLGVYV